MKEHLQQHVAQLLREFGAVLPVENFQHFVGFFEQIGFQRLMRLLAVPWTSVRRAQRGHQINERMKSFRHGSLMVPQSWALIIPGSRQASIGWRSRRVGRRSLRRFRGYDSVPSLHLERGKGLWPQNRKKDLSFGIGGAGVDPTGPPPLRLPRRGQSLTRRRRLPTRTRVQEFPSPFHH